ncbi:MAG: hypothetical protein K2Q28_10125 [Hyphomicrobium sp.]|jgi:predicted nucleic acid-binding protein|nr:hypothetical protein [Hyphomicrobium sp.]
MTPPSSWPDAHGPLILDASAVINLNGSGAARAILEALEGPVVVAEDVIGELERGISNGRRDAELLHDLVAAGLVGRQALGQVGLQIFERLTIGSSAETLEDGEAASIGLALEIGGVAVIDETKGRRLAALTAPAVPLLGSIDLFGHSHVQKALGNDLADVVFRALQQARMQVLVTHHDWVASLVGPERLKLCDSLPRSIRGG